MDGPQEIIAHSTRRYDSCFNVQKTSRKVKEQELHTLEAGFESCGAKSKISLIDSTPIASNGHGTTVYTGPITQTGTHTGKEDMFILDGGS